MRKVKEDIKSLYAINLVEGEGVGTAYEYHVKLRKLRKFVNSIENPKKVLIAGLPEKYGLSMDFLLFAQMLQAETVVVDERSKALERGENAYRNVKDSGYFNDITVNFIKIDEISGLSHQSFKDGQFDIALSSEVYQRLDGAQETYISNLKRISKNFAVFAPNGGNESHARFSGLKSVYLMDLLKSCKKGQPEHAIYDYGFLDMPPFPPGLNRSKEKRNQVAESRIETFLMKGLEIYCLGEYLFPKFVKKKIAHIVYVMAKT
jgi:hypothetical protein